MSLLPNYTALNRNVDFFLKAGDAVVVESVAAPDGDVLTLKGGAHTEIEIGASSVSATGAISYNTVTGNGENLEFLASGAGAGGCIDFFAQLPSGYAPIAADRKLRVTSEGIETAKINSAIIGAQGWSNLQPGAIPTATATGPAGFEYFTIPSIGSSNIPVVPGGVYSIGGSVRARGNSSGTFKYFVGLNNGANDTILYGMPAVNVRDQGLGPFYDIPFSFNGTFIPVGSNVQIYISNEVTAGPAESVAADLQPLYLTRIR